MYEIEYTPGPGFMRADVVGDLAAPDTRVEAWARMIRHCRAKAVTRLLVVQDSPGNGNVANAYLSSEGIARLGLEGIRIAFVDLDPANLEVNQFGELVAANRGADAKVFSEEGSALEWLLQD